jgi:hypothetical protein
MQLILVRIKGHIKVILHQFWVKKISLWKFNLEYGGTFTKLFMHEKSAQKQIWRTNRKIFDSR